MICKYPTIIDFKKQIISKPQFSLFTILNLWCGCPSEYWIGNDSESMVEFLTLSTAPPRTLVWARSAERKACATLPVGRPRAPAQPCRLALLAVPVDGRRCHHSEATADWSVTVFTCLLLFLTTLHGLWDLSSPTRGWTQALGSESADPNHWTVREVLLICFMWNKPPFPTTN